MKKQPRYVLITPAHNEGRYVEQLVQSILAQTNRPTEWVIVDDVSTDETSQIVKQYGEKYDFIHYHRVEAVTHATYYSRKIIVWHEGYEQICEKEYQYIGSLDADITLPTDYYENMLTRFEDDPLLGIATGVYVEKIDGRLAPLISRHAESTPGGIQLFRRQCFEEVGGYRPLKYGGEDTLAEIMARMHGWKTRSYPQYQVVHHRPVGQRGRGALRAKFRQGLSDYQLGSHPLFMLAKWIRRIFLERPYFLSSSSRLVGYLWGYVFLAKSQVPEEVVYFYRQQQRKRLRNVVSANKAVE